MKKWVLVVDDDPINLRMAGKILSDEGLRASSFKSGESFIAFLEGFDGDIEPDAFLLDVRMPGMDGFETLERVRTMEKYRDVPVLFLTGDDNGDVLDKCSSLGDLVKKPFGKNELMAHINKIVA